jgi:hypothetical protein
MNHIDDQNILLNAEDQIVFQQPEVCLSPDAITEKLKNLN